MRSEELKQYIRDRGTLFWYSPGDKGETVTDELLVVHILNYGTMDDVRELFRVMGLRQVAAVFRSGGNSPFARTSITLRPSNSCPAPPSIRRRSARFWSTVPWRTSFEPAAYPV